MDEGTDQGIANRIITQSINHLLQNEFNGDISGQLYRQLCPKVYDTDYAFSGGSYHRYYHKHVHDIQGLQLMEEMTREGTYGSQVWDVVDVNDNHHYAMKVVSLHYHSARNSYNIRKAVTALYHESKTLLSLSHANIMKAVREFSLPDPSTGVPFLLHCFLMDRMDESLEALMRRQPHERLPERVAREWFTQIAGAVDYLHNGLREAHGLWVSHMAIRPVNILCKRVDASDHRIFKLTDFQESICFAAGAVDTCPQERLLRSYFWLELKFQRTNTSTKAVDVFGLGMTLTTTLVGWQMYRRFVEYLSNYTPIPDIPALHWKDLTHEEQDVFPCINPELGRLIANTLQPYPQRLTITQLLADYFDEYFAK